MKKLKLIVFDNASGMYVGPTGDLRNEIHRFDSYQEAEHAVLAVMLANDWGALNRLEMRFDAVPVASKEARAKATILAALRYWQRLHCADGSAAEHGIATNGRTFIALTKDEIDTLCEQINCGEVTFGN